MDTPNLSGGEPELTNSINDSQGTSRVTEVSAKKRCTESSAREIAIDSKWEKSTWVTLRVDLGRAWSLYDLRDNPLRRKLKF